MAETSSTNIYPTLASFSNISCNSLLSSKSSAGNRSSNLTDLPSSVVDDAPGQEHISMIRDCWREGPNAVIENNLLREDWDQMLDGLEWNLAWDTPPIDEK